MDPRCQNERKRQTALPMEIASASTLNDTPTTLRPLHLLSDHSVIQSTVKQHQLPSASPHRLRRNTALNSYSDIVSIPLATIDEDQSSIVPKETNSPALRAQSFQSAETNIQNSSEPSFTRIVNPFTVYRGCLSLTRQTDRFILSHDEKGRSFAISRLRDGGKMDVVRKQLTDIHPNRCENIVRLVEIIIHEDSFFIVKEYVPINLFEMMSSPVVVENIDERSLAAVAHGVCQTLPPLLKQTWLLILPAGHKCNTVFE